MDDVIAQLFERLALLNLPSVRHYQEIFAINLIRREPGAFFRQRVLARLTEYDLSAQEASSMLIIGGSAALHVVDDTLRAPLREAFLRAALPWLACTDGLIRILAQFFVATLVEAWDAERAASGADDAPLSLAEQYPFLGACTDFLERNKKCRTMRHKIRIMYEKYDPERSASLEALLATPTDDMLGEKCEVPLTRMVQLAFKECIEIFRADAKESALLRELQMRRRKGQDISETWQPVAAGSDAPGAAGTAAPPGSGAAAAEARAAAAEAAAEEAAQEARDFQQKIAPWSDEEFTRHQLEAEMLSGVQSDAASSRQELIVVASLIDKLPNLAGLARTCEIFKASQLCLNDISITKQENFERIAVTAQKWVPIIEVQPAQLESFLLERRAAGYALIGVEQTARSVSIESFAFPSRAVVVLGKEKEGIPAQFLRLLDQCIEIPQLGIIRCVAHLPRAGPRACCRLPRSPLCAHTCLAMRPLPSCFPPIHASSLNVHVSGAIAIWEYTRQQLLRRAAATAATAIITTAAAVAHD